MKLQFLIAAAMVVAPLAAGTAQTGDGGPVQLLTLVGLKIVGGKPINRCGTPGTPHVALLDFNGDRQKNEALFTDTGPCYAPDNAYFALAARDAPNKPWRLLFSHTGTVKAVASTTQGWLDLEYSSGGRTVPIRYAGGLYASALAGATKAAPAAAPAQASAGMVSPSAKPAALTPAQRNAVFKAAGAERRGAKWLLCSDQPDPQGATIESISDLNGDGRAEVVVTDGGTFCYGNTGTGFVLLSQQADGSWKQMAGETGIATFLKTRSLGWPDLEVGGPGFCFPVSRWSGKEYVFHHFNEYMKGMCAQNGLKPAVRAY
ncbi:MAG: hypothetical protein ABW023_03775 [Sphingomonas sp.]